MIVVKYFDTGTGKWADVTGQTGDGLTIGANGWDVEPPSAIVYWGDILGDISGQTDLKNALDNKLEVVTNADISGFINANKIGTGAVSNTEFAYVSGVTSAIQTQIDSKLQKELGPYEMWANNSGSSAEASGEAFQYTDELTYSGTITWTGTTAPSGATNHSYQWERVGKLVTLRICLNYGSAGSTLTAVNMALPGDVPNPLVPAGFSGNSSVIYNGSAHMSNALTVSTAVHRGHMRINSGSTGYELFITTGTSGAYRYAQIIITYFAE
jgi:hypothetical protein